MGTFALQFAFNSLGQGLLKNIPGFAEGGRPEPNKPSLVGEKGPEIFIPIALARIPNDRAFDDARGALVDVSARPADGSGGGGGICRSRWSACS